MDSPSKWQPQKADLWFSIILAAGLPVVCGTLYEVLGALLPMVLYYALAWGFVYWRRGSIGYLNKPRKKLPISFVINLVVISISLVFAYIARIVPENTNPTGTVLSALIWPVINGATEQILWIYLFEAWDLQVSWDAGDKNRSRRNWTYRVVGLLVSATFIGMIHVMYWAKFLHTVDSTQVAGLIFILITTVSGFLHFWVWRESNQMIFTFIPHYLLNLLPFFWTGYSLVPYLF